MTYYYKLSIYFKKLQLLFIKILLTFFIKKKILGQPRQVSKINTFFYLKKKENQEPLDFWPPPHFWRGGGFYQFPNFQVYYQLLTMATHSNLKNAFIAFLAPLPSILFYLSFLNHYHEHHPIYNWCYQHPLLFANLLFFLNVNLLFWVIGLLQSSHWVILYFNFLALTNFIDEFSC